MNDSHNQRERERDRNEWLCLRCQRGDRAAWNELVEAWDRPLYYFVRRILPDEQEALAALQDIWLQVFGGLASVQDPRRLAPWLYTLARRTAWRQRGRPPAAEPPSAELHDHEDPSGSPFERLDDAEAVHWALARLPPQQAELLVLYFLDDLSLAELSQVLEIPIGTAKSRLHAARRTMRAALHSEHDRHDS